MALCGKGNPINWRYSWDERQQGGEVQGRLLRIAEAMKERESEAGKVDLAINCDGFNPLTQTLQLDRTKMGGGKPERNRKVNIAVGMR